MSNTKLDQNNMPAALAVDSLGEIKRLKVDPVSDALLAVIITDSGSPHSDRSRRIDANNEHTVCGIDPDGNIRPILVDPDTGYLLANITF